MNKKLFITGASGFIGYHLIKEALLQGDEVFAAVRSTSAVAHLQQLNINLVYPDFQDTEQLKKDFEKYGITHVVHAAAVTKAGSQDAYSLANAVLARNIALAASSAHTDLKSFVFISSLAAMGPSVNGQALTENNVPHPVTFYGKSKLLAEQYLSEIDLLPLTILRPTAVYGPREKDLFIVLNMIKKGWELYIGNGPQRLSFVYVDDLVKLVFSALDTPGNGKCYHVSDGQVYDRYALASITKSLLHKRTIKLQVPLKVVKLVIRLQEKFKTAAGKVSILNNDKLKELTASWECSIESARRDLQYNPAYILKDGLAQTIQWYLANKWF